jgi:hypothetical protein
MEERGLPAIGLMFLEVMEAETLEVEVALVCTTTEVTEAEMVAQESSSYDTLNL